MTVYVLQRPKANQDVTPARVFGELKVVWGEDFMVFPDNAERRTKEMNEYARKILANFDATKDYILLNGDPVGISIATAILSETWEEIIVLKWDRMNSAYYPVKIDI